jgi:hypothetical protein
MRERGRGREREGEREITIYLIQALRFQINDEVFYLLYVQIIVIEEVMFLRNQEDRIYYSLHVLINELISCEEIIE